MGSTAVPSILQWCSYSDEIFPGASISSSHDDGFERRGWGINVMRLCREIWGLFHQSEALSEDDSRVRFVRHIPVHSWACLARIQYNQGRKGGRHQAGDPCSAGAIPTTNTPRVVTPSLSESS